MEIDIDTPINPKYEDYEDLFRPCVKEDPCGACPNCCQDELGFKGENS